MKRPLACGVVLAGWVTGVGVAFAQTGLPAPEFGVAQASRSGDTLPSTAGAAGADQLRGHDGAHPSEEGTPDPVPPRPPAAPLPPHVPPVTDADRAAAFPDVGAHALGDNAIRAFVLLDQLEWHSVDHAVGWDARAWVGRDRDRLWFRTEGERGRGSVRSMTVHALYGRAFARWWDVVAGVRQDFDPGQEQTWAAVGLQGLAPYWFELDVTGYVGGDGRTQLQFDLEHDLLLSNWLILQPHVEFELFGRDDPRRGIGAGLSSSNLGLRLRYEVRRELAPYLGVVWHRQYFGTAAMTRDHGGHATSGAELVVGLRTWF